MMGVSWRRTAYVAIVALAALSGFGVASLRQPPVNVVVLDDKDAVNTTIEEVRAAPKSFAGKRIKLAGKLDECFRWECSICPEGMTNKTRNADQCLALSFRPLIPQTGFGSDEQETVFRFASVVLTATFDPSCWEGLCVDRQTVLRDAQTISVGERRSSNTGLWIKPPVEIVEITGPSVGEIKTAAYAAGFPQRPPMKVFAARGDATKIVVCWTPVGEQVESWPTSREGALFARSKSDFYECSAVRKIGDRYVVQAQGYAEE